MVENPVFDLNIKHFPAVRGCGDKLFCGTWNSIELIIKKNATLMAQEGVIVQITYCFILKYNFFLTLMCIVIFLSNLGTEKWTFL